MLNTRIEIGKIVNTHALKGEIKIQPWCDDPEIYFDLDEIYVNNKTYFIEKARIHKNFVIVKFEEVNSIEEAELLKILLLKLKETPWGNFLTGFIIYVIC